MKVNLQASVSQILSEELDSELEDLETAAQKRMGRKDRTWTD